MRAHFVSIPWSRLGVSLLAGLSLLGASCQKKHAHEVPAVMAPAIATEPPPSSLPPALPAENATTAPLPDLSAKPAAAQKPKPKPRRAAKPKQPPAQTPAPAAQPEVPKPSAPSANVQITADVPRAAVQTQRQNTLNLLHASENKLGSLSRALNETEQGMVRQARNYIVQSNEALQSGDVERAYNLAVKASLLANELTK